ncbi:MAG: hypothetical protein COT24_03020 [Candidatus Kerfeldbacteria bacterium CG08_land_8_20_14_0_20_40_16]|uniref:HAD family hydrolase n=1 Tax=Candidatus Kerfeldbacteria bacterium CG08_land_8_20_14_0_20_40_16 TaxID=2014244 RepID=A0A2H0YVJ8_9BACT|nr:MAG: hypothetical protein COT24_03020 [Candidatus Kerfeldbacteria bacterium CG08_land_8_20_14_0_20_40_16]
MKIILDFDYTLFNAQDFKQALRDRFSLFGISSEQFDDSYFTIKQQLGYYNYNKHLKMLAQNNKINENDLILSFQEIVDSAREFLYPDSLFFLKTIKNIPDAFIYLLTFGQDKLQQSKIEASGIKKYFDKIIDTTNSKMDLLKIDRNVSDIVIINDRGKEIDEIKQQLPPVKAIWLRRPYSLYFNEGCRQKDFEASTLSEALSFIKTFINNKD